MTDFNNYQLISTGFVNGRTAVIDTNYSGSYEIFRLFMFGIDPSSLNAVYGLTFNNQNIGYLNMNSASGSCVILSNDVTNPVTGHFTLDITFYWPAFGGSPQPVTVVGSSTYLSTGVSNLVRYEIGGFVVVNAAGGGIPSPFLSITDVLTGSTIVNNIARYNLYGLSGFGAANI
jgi:hypothetical protein